MSTTTQQKATKNGHKTSQGENVSILSTDWNVTNNTGTDLVIMDAFASDPTSLDQLYQSSLQLLSLTEGQQVLKAGETKSISIGAAHTGRDGNTVDYTVIIARADNLFPVKIVTLPTGGDGFPNTIVTAEDASQLKKAEDFVQAITAFPSSQMTKDFSSVLANPDEQKLSAFFQSYSAYASVTLETVTAVQTYYNRYGFVWAGYNKAQTFSLYTTDGVSTKKNLGTITLNDGTLAPVTTLDAPVGFAVTYMDPNHRKTTLHYANGQFSEDVASISPKICIAGLFMLKSSLTGNDADNFLVPLLFGVVNGVQAFGFVDSTSSLMAAEVTVSSIKDFFTPQNLSGWLKLCGLCVGALALLAGIGGVAYYFIKIRRARTLAELQQRNRETLTKNLDRMAKAGVTVPTDLTQSLDAIKAEANNNLLADNKAKITDILQKQLSATEKLISYGSTPDLQKATWSIENDLQFKLDSMDPADLPASMDYFKNKIQSNVDIINSRVKTIENKLTVDDLLEINDANRRADRYKTFVDTNEKIREDLINDRLPEIIEE